MPPGFYTNVIFITAVYLLKIIICTPNEGHLENDISSGTGTGKPSLDPLQQEYVKIICECRQCSILGYIRGEDQCSGSEPPKIEWAPHPPDSKELVSKTKVSLSIFMSNLLDETRKVNREFCTLLQETITRLEEKKTISEVRRYTRSLLALPDMYARLDSSSDGVLDNVTNFEDFQKFLENNYCSWFNFSIVSDLRKQFLFSLPEEDKSLVEYTKHFNQYIKRRCFIYLEDVGSQPKDVQTVELICKVDNIDLETVTITQLHKVKQAVIECFQFLSEYNLTLKHVREGCIKVVFRAPACLRSITTLTPLQVTQLRTSMYKFLEVQIGDKMLLSKVILFFNYEY